jgi:hypothetical protein
MFSISFIGVVSIRISTDGGLVVRERYKFVSGRIAIMNTGFRCKWIYDILY